MSDEVKLVFTMITFEREVLPWLYRLLGWSVAEPGYKNFFRNAHRSDEDLYHYCDKIFNPLLNTKLNRDKAHPTFAGLVEWAMKDLVMKHPAISKHQKDEFLYRVHKKKLPK